MLCPKCKQDRSEQDFTSVRGRTAPRQVNTCTSCRSKRMDAYRRTECTATAKTAAIERTLKWNQANPERRRALGREIQARQKQYHPEKVQARYTEWRKANVEVAREAARAWARNNPEKRRLNELRNEARRLNLEPIADSVFLKLMSETHCTYCRCEFGVTDATKRTIDHIIPVSRGGDNSPENLCAACQACNRSKNNRTPEEWAAAKKRDRLFARDPADKI